MIQKAVILAGGRGTRLATVVSDKPKPMADIHGLPFLHYLILDLKKKGIREVVLLVGYMREVIQEYFKSTYHGVDIRYEIEDSPRGTGGLVAELSKKWNEDILLINGDTYFDVDLSAMYDLFIRSSCITIAVKDIENSDRYGVLEIDEDRIVDFKEKTFVSKGYINGGIYLLPKGIFENLELPFSFSLEKDFFEQYKNEQTLIPFYSQGFFIDIGIPTDYELAQTQIPLQLFPHIDRTWTLFLDRDGVINEHIPDSYVLTQDDFKWIDGSKEAIAMMSKHVGRIIVVTNQQGVGKKMMTKETLDSIHCNMQREVEAVGGKIDRVYYCPHLAHIKPKCRKPNIGMAMESKLDFPEIDFNKSIIVGDMMSDMEFGQKLGMMTVLISNSKWTKREILRFDRLYDFSLFLEHKKIPS